MQLVVAQALVRQAVSVNFTLCSARSQPTEPGFWPDKADDASLLHLRKVNKLPEELLVKMGECLGLPGYDRRRNQGGQAVEWSVVGCMARKWQADTGWLAVQVEGFVSPQASCAGWEKEPLGGAEL